MVTNSERATEDGGRRPVRALLAAGAAAALLAGAAVTASGRDRAHADPGDVAGRAGTVRVTVQGDGVQLSGSPGGPWWVATSYEWSAEQPVDQGSGRPTAGARFGEFTFTHRVQAGTVKLPATMILNRPRLDVRVELVDADQPDPSPYLTYELKDAYVTKLTHSLPSTDASDDAVRVDPVEKISIAYDSAVLTDDTGQTEWYRNP